MDVKLKVPIEMQEMERGRDIYIYKDHNRNGVSDRNRETEAQTQTFSHVAQLSSSYVSCGTQKKTFHFLPCLIFLTSVL